MSSQVTPTVPTARAEPQGEPTKQPRRRACNECKQQKLRCDLVAGDSAPSTCSRCQRLSLACKVDTDFRRTRKRRKSFELENEVRELRRQLATRETTNAALEWPILTPAAPSEARVSEAAVSSVSGASGVSPDPKESSRVPGLTTQPVIDQPQAPRRSIITIPRARKLGNVELSVEEIDELYLIYILHYHPYLPFLDPSTSLHEYFESSELLFWSIISVAARRLQSHPTLLPKLARSVTDYLWKTLRSIPYSLRAVQSLVILCTWPFPTSSSTADPTYMLAGMMVQIGTQMGLHRALNAEDFVKVPLHLSVYEYSEWVKTWEACNIVAQSVSVGCGLPATIQMHDWSLTVAPESTMSSPHDIALRWHLRIEQFRYRVSQALTSNALDPAGFMSARERLSLYRLLNASLVDLEREAINMTPITRYYLAAARLHLHSFYLFDEPSVDGYSDRIVVLYQTAYSLIEQCLEMDNQESGFFHYCPFFCYQVFVSAAFIILKVMMNGYFEKLLDIEAGKRLLDAAISSLRKMSVANNDLPGRLSDVIGFFCTLPDPRVISGDSVDDLRLRVRNRLSMSIVYDSLWEWRKHFQADGGDNENSEEVQDKLMIPNYARLR
ncbi:fungal specific transcription factor domain-containing protein [Trichoderma breve]|uniref:Fungal specific transcription factor domain-containing protein n=1 Tax=Trichoderma breve TaxID=2034170 RepID=A0A9W9E838_9HYPO|nr:fungal specific transcription factor domain-containing protein [Trichoderma breve]KAJ4860032.1 fungal specific transcription factor domain-containing protein [Trichoderma breve]